VMKKKNLEKD